MIIFSIKKYSFIFFLFFIILFNQFNIVKAQELSQRWVCLNAERFGVHEAKLTVKEDNKLIPNSDTYIVECINNDSNCTSGNSQLDLKIFGQNNLELLSNNFNYEFQGMTPNQNPIKSNASGFLTEPIIWKSYTSQAQTRRWLALNYFETETTLGTGNDKSQKLGTFSFEEIFNNSDCVTLRWDPYGRIFDTDTLEPVYGAKVSLFIKENNNYKLFTNVVGGIINPITTKEDGAFSFVVPDGTYKLVVEMSNYKFPVEINEVNNNYSKIYANIYPANTGEDIIQKGAIQHRDIPIKPLSISQDKEAVLLEKFENLNKTNKILNLTGRISHPFTKISAYSLKLNNNTRSKEIATAKADKDGNFNLKINLSQLNEDEYFGDLVLTKINLTENNLTKLLNKFFSFFVKKTYGQTITKSYRLNPILNYIEGYAYNKNGDIMPNATVQVVLNFSQSPFYTTKTNEKGYFKISSNNLPSFPYKLIFIDSNGIKLITNTSDFIAKNKEFLTLNKVNFNQFKIVTEESKLNQQKNNIIKPTFINQAPFNNFDNKENNLNKNQKSLTNSIKNNKLIIIFLILVLLILGIFGLLYFYIKKRSSVNPPTY